MKKLLLFAICLVTGAAYAQDPDLGGNPIVGTTGVSGPFAINDNVSFGLITGNGGGDMLLPAPTATNGSSAPYTVLVTTANIGLPVVTLVSGTNYYAPPVITDLGDGRYTILLTQILPIPEQEYTTFTISGKTVKTYVDPDDGKYYAGYKAKGNPGGYADTNSGLDNPEARRSIGDVDLPVTLTAFTAHKISGGPEGESALLSWATTMETNSNRFEIQHSLKGKAWETVGTVQSNGESSIQRKYNFTHSSPVRGQNLYRLKMVDNDETFELSRIIGLTFDGLAGNIAVYPNPTTDKLFIQNEDLAQVKQVVIINQSGNSVYKSNAVSSNGINVTNLASGTYILNITKVDGTINNRKFLVIR